MEQILLSVQEVEVVLAKNKNVYVYHDVDSDECGLIILGKLHSLVGLDFYNEVYSLNRYPVTRAQLYKFNNSEGDVEYSLEVRD